jgi:3',5'-cyclic AMP phosphodiesterase CpdA
MAQLIETASPLGGMAASALRVPGLPRRLRAFHITDSHLDFGPEAESGSRELCEYLSERYKGGFKANMNRGPGTVHGHTARDPVEIFEAQVASAAEQGVDVLIHTGDLLNFPSPRSAAWVAETVRRSGIPHFLFISGNHDWQHCPITLEGVEKGSDRLRREWRARALPALFPRGRGMSHWHEDIGGLRFIGVDNSTNYITPEQLAWFEATAVAPGPPVVLLLHVPIRLPALMEEGRPDGGGVTGTATLRDKRDGKGSVMDGIPTDAEEAEWSEGVSGVADAALSTTRFIALVQGLPRLVAVLAGHIHDHNAHAVGAGGGVQFTTDAGCYAGCRLLDFEPAEQGRL